MPTILAYLGIEPPRAAVGRNIGLAAPEPESSSRTLVFESNWGKQQAAVWRGDLKAIFHEDGSAREEVYRLTTDPLERIDLAASDRGRRFVVEARRALASHRERSRRHREENRLHPLVVELSGLSSEEVDALLALGYVDR